MQKSKYHRSQTLKYRCGYSLPVRPTVAIGGDKITINQLTENDLDELSNTRPTLTYGNVTRPAQIQFIPAHVAFDKKVHICMYCMHACILRCVYVHAYNNVFA